MLKIKLQQSPTQRSVTVYVLALLATVSLLVQLTLCLVTVVVDMDVAIPGTIKLYWTDHAGQFTEINSKRAKLHAGHNSQVFTLLSTSDLASLRINPINSATQIKLNAIVVSSLKYKPLIYTEKELAARFKAIKDIVHIEKLPNTLRFETVTSEAQFEIATIYDATKSKTLKLGTWFSSQAIVLIIMVCIALGFFYRPLHLAGALLSILLVSLSGIQADLKGVLLKITLQSTVSNELTTYWSDVTRVFSEERARRTQTFENSSVYRLDLGRLKKIDSIRIDPSNTKCKVSIQDITLEQFGYYPIHLNAKNKFYAIDFAKQPNVSIQGNYLVFDVKTADDSVELLLNTDAFKMRYSLIAYSSLLCLLLVMLGVFYGTQYYYPRYFSRAKTACQLLSVVILSLLSALSFWGSGFSLKTKVHDLVLSTSGMQSHYVLSAFPKETTGKILAWIPLIDCAYGVLLLISIIAVILFYNKKIAVLYSVFLALGYLVFLIFKSNSTLITLDIELFKADALNIYWANEGENFSQQRSVSIKTDAGRHQYTLAIENLNNIHTIRIEPITTAGQANIHQISIVEPGYDAIILDGTNHFYAIDPYKISKSTNKPTQQAWELRDNKLLFGSDTSDEYVEIIVDPEAFKSQYGFAFYAKLLLLYSGFLACIYTAALKWTQSCSDLAALITRLSFAIIVLMILQLAWLSEYDYHPDERSHINSLEYFTQYSNFPTVGDARAMDAYQYPWGVSRLDDLGISYFLMGKLKNWVTHFMEDTVFVCRLFNGLLIFMLFAGTRNTKFAAYLIPLLCLPQVWYLFSYTNRDSFALFLAILLAWNIHNKESQLNQYLLANAVRPQWTCLLLPGLLLGLLSIELSNYLIFILYVVATLTWQAWFAAPKRKHYVVKCLLLFMLASSIYGIRKAVDIHINGFNKQEQKTAFAEAIAGAEFKPSIAGTESGFFGLRLQQKGVNALDLFSPQWDWHNLTFKSFTGLYGNEFAEYSPEWYYTCVGFLYAIIAILLLYRVLRYGTIKFWLFTLVTGLAIAGDLLMGFLYSWLYDFQPQGRYIFPLIPIVMGYCWTVRPVLSLNAKAILWANIMLLMWLSFYSFRGIALNYMVA